MFELVNRVANDISLKSYAKSFQIWSYHSYTPAISLLDMTFINLYCCLMKRVCFMIPGLLIANYDAGEVYDLTTNPQVSQTTPIPAPVILTVSKPTITSATKTPIQTPFIVSRSLVPVVPTNECPQISTVLQDESDDESGMYLTCASTFTITYYHSISLNITHYHSLSHPHTHYHPHSPTLTITHTHYHPYTHYHPHTH
jgi:hypothetical protein